MSFNILEVGDKIDLYNRPIKSGNEADNKPQKIYKSKIYDLEEENKMRIAMPIEGGKVILLPVDGKFIMDFYTSHGIYQAKGKITDRYKDQNLYVLVVELFSELVKNQRREFYRYNCSIDMMYATIEASEMDFETVEEIETKRGENLPWVEGFIADISGGGTRFISGSQHEKNSYGIFKFTLMIKNEFKEFILKGEILSSETLINREHKYENRMKFIGIQKDQTEDIIRYIFEEERRSRKNRKS